MAYIDINNYTYNGKVIPMEFWKPITDDMVKNIKSGYWISNIGNSYSEISNKFLNGTLKYDGYIAYTYKLTTGKYISIMSHVLVNKAFNSPKPKGNNIVVDHLNGIKSCNYEENLEWVTQQENCNRAIKNGLTKIAGDLSYSLFNNNEVHEICKLLESGFTVNETLKAIGKYNENDYKNNHKYSQAISMIKNNFYYKSISKNYNIKKGRNYTLTNDELIFVCDKIESGYIPNQIYSQMIRGNNPSVRQAIYVISSHYNRFGDLNLYRSRIN